MSDEEPVHQSSDDENDETFKSRCTVNLRPGGIPTRSKSGSARKTKHSESDSSEPTIPDTELNMSVRSSENFSQYHNSQTPITFTGHEFVKHLSRTLTAGLTPPRIKRN